jgi:lysophospholipase
MRYAYWKTAEGFYIRYGHWPCEDRRARGGVVVLNGRAEFMEKYAGVCLALNRRGFDAFSLDWRGQGLSSRLLPDRRKGHIESYADYLADLHHLVRKVAAPATSRPLLLLGHSLGGHLALRYLHDQPRQLAAAVLVSPLIRILDSPLLEYGLRVLTGAALLMGHAGAYSPGARATDPLQARFAGNRYTSDSEQFARVQQLLAANPALVVGGVTCGWLAATLASIRKIHAPGYARAIDRPLLLFSAGRERVVSVRAQRRLCARLPQCQYVPIAGARHEILMETAAVRRIFWQHFDRFTRAVGV